MASVASDISGKRFSLGKLDFVAEKPMDGGRGAYKMTCKMAGADGTSEGLSFFAKVGDHFGDI